MATPKKLVKVDKNPVPEIEIPAVDSVEVKEEVEETSAKVKTEKVKWPEVGTVGRFHAVEFEHGYVVYNPGGQRATGIISKDQAADIVREQNRAAQIR